METGLPGVKEASYRLLGLQALVQENGVILKRGMTRLWLEGPEVAELLDLLVDRLTGGRSFELTRLKAEVTGEQREPLMALVETLRAHRVIVPQEEAGTPRREDVFFWNYRTNFASVVGELSEVSLTVFGVNSIALALLGNLRGCGFRDISFVDHPALRNLDYFDAKRKLRAEIAAALSNPPQEFDAWQAENKHPEGCFVVCSDFGGRPLVRDWNRFCVEHGVMLYPIILLDHVVHLGPMIVPGEGPCYECLWTRQNSNMADVARSRAGELDADLGQHAIGYLQPMARAAADFGALELLKIFSTPLPGGKIGRILDVDLMGPSVESREFLKVPRCPVCGDVVPKAKPRPVEAEPTEIVAEPKAESAEPEADEAEAPVPAKDVA
jgi:bacteriocin biosynthesis cyclodehydratase domain-containing protein